MGRDEQRYIEASWRDTANMGVVTSKWDTAD